MYTQAIVMVVAAVGGVVAVLGSRVLRAICREAIVYLKQHCEIRIHPHTVSVRRFHRNQKEERS